MTNFKTCTRCGRTIDIEKESYVKDEKKDLNCYFVFYFCLDCLDEMIEIEES